MGAITAERLGQRQPDFILLPKPDEREELRDQLYEPLGEAVERMGVRVDIPLLATHAADTITKLQHAEQQLRLGDLYTQLDFQGQQYRAMLAADRTDPALAGFTERLRMLDQRIGDTQKELRRQSGIVRLKDIDPYPGNVGLALWDADLRGNSTNGRMRLNLMRTGQTMEHIPYVGFEQTPIAEYTIRSAQQLPLSGDRPIFQGSSTHIDTPICIQGTFSPRN